MQITPVSAAAPASPVTPLTEASREKTPTQIEPVSAVTPVTEAAPKQETPVQIAPVTEAAPRSAGVHCERQDRGQAPAKHHDGLPILFPLRQGRDGGTRHPGKSRFSWKSCILL